MSTSTHEPMRFQAEEADGLEHEDISQQMWTILVTLAARHGGRVDLSPVELSAVAGLRGRLHLDEEGGACVSIENMPSSPSLPAATHGSTHSLH